MVVTHRASAAASLHTTCAHIEGGWGGAFFSPLGTKLRGDWYTILPEFAKYIPPPDRPSTGMTSTSHSFRIKTFDALQAAVYQMFPEEAALIDKQNRTLWRSFLSLQ